MDRQTDGQTDRQADRRRDESTTRPYGLLAKKRVNGDRRTDDRQLNYKTSNLGWLGLLAKKRVNTDRRTDGRTNTRRQLISATNQQSEIFTGIVNYIDLDRQLLADTAANKTRPSRLERLLHLLIDKYISIKDHYDTWSCLALQKYPKREIKYWCTLSKLQFVSILLLNC